MRRALRHLVLACIGVFAALAGMARVSAQLEGETDADAMMQYQRDFIERFSGVVPYDGDKTLAARSSNAQRRVARDILMAEIEKMGVQATRQHYRMPNPHWILDLFAPPYQGANIVVDVPATIDTDDYVIIGAHYDSEPDSPGANDNGTGVAIMLWTVRQLLALDERQYHVRAVLFDQEEEGKIGSTAYVRQITRQGLSVHSVHTADLIGWDGDGDGVVEVEMPDGEIADLYEQVAGRLGITLARAEYDSSDHVPFREHGMRAVIISEEFAGGDYSPYYHSPEDTVDHVNFPYLAEATRLFVGVQTELAAGHE